MSTAAAWVRPPIPRRRDNNRRRLLLLLTLKINLDSIVIVKLREREGQRVDPGRSLKGHLWMVDGGYPFPDALH